MPKRLKVEPRARQIEERKEPAPKRQRADQKVEPMLVTSKEELAARQRRLERFGSAAPGPSSKPQEKADAPVQAKIECDDWGDWTQDGKHKAAPVEAKPVEAKPVEGDSSDVAQKPPKQPKSSEPQPQPPARARDARPEPVLKQAFEVICAKWNQYRDWSYVGQTLRSIRQDLTVQMIRSIFTVQVYEFCARTALEMNDFTQFEECSAKLEELHSDVEIGASTNMVEFLASRLLYLTLQGDTLQSNIFLRKHSLVFGKAARGKRPFAYLAMRLTTHVKQGNLTAVLQLVDAASKDEVASLAPLLKPLVETVRLRQLIALCRACRPSVSRGTLNQLLHCTGEANGGLGVASLADLPLVDHPSDAILVDSELTATAADRRLAAVRQRFGEARTEMFRGSMRQPRSGDRGSGADAGSDAQPLFRTPPPAG